MVDASTGRLHIFVQPDWTPVPHRVRAGYQCQTIFRLDQARAVADDPARIDRLCMRMMDCALQHTRDLQAGRVFLCVPRARRYAGGDHRAQQDLVDTGGDAQGSSRDDPAGPGTRTTTDASLMGCGATSRNSSWTPGTAASTGWAWTSIDDGNARWAPDLRRLTSRGRETCGKMPRTRRAPCMIAAVKRRAASTAMPRLNPAHARACSTTSTCRRSLATRRAMTRVKSRHGPPLVFDTDQLAAKQ